MSTPFPPGSPFPPDAPYPVVYRRPNTAIAAALTGGVPAGTLQPTPRMGIPGQMNTVPGHPKSQALAQALIGALPDQFKQ